MWPTNDQHIPQQFPFLKQVLPNADYDVVVVPGGDFWTKLRATFVAGSGAPDITLLEISWISQAVNSPGALVEITPYVNQNWPGLMDKFFPAPVKAAQDAKGLQMAFPKEIGPGVLYYRMDLLQKAGFPTVDPDAMHKLLPDWDALFQQSAKFAQKGQIWPFAAADDILGRRYAQLGWASVQDGKPNLQAPEIMDALTLAKKFFDAGYTAEIQGDALNAAVAGSKIGFYQAASWWESVLVHGSDPKGIGQWHLTDAAGGGFDQGGDFYAVTTQCQGGDNGKLTAMKAIQWFATDSHKFDFAWQQDLSPGAYMPLFDSDPITKQPIPYLGGQVVGDYVKRAAATMKAPVLDPRQGIVTAALAKAEDAVLHKGTDIKQALADAQKEAVQNMQ